MASNDNRPYISPELNERAMDIAYDANVFWERSQHVMMDRGPIWKSFDCIAKFRETGDVAHLNQAKELIDSVRDMLE